MSHVLIDGIANLTVSNGVLRVECTAAGADGQSHPSGTLVIPGAVAGQVLQALINGMQELEKKIREHQAQAAAPEKKN
jgi:hypothetical protein